MNHYTETTVYEHNDINDLSAFDISFEKRRTGWQDLDGQWHSDDNLNAISNAFISLLTTTPGEKILNPLFGINFGDLLFLPVTEERADVIGSSILTNIEKFEPRIKILNLTITPAIEQQEYICDFIYTIPRFNNEKLNLKGKLSSSGFYV